MSSGAGQRAADQAARTHGHSSVALPARGCLTCWGAGLVALLLLRPACRVELPARLPARLVPAHRQLHVQDGAQQGKAPVCASARRCCCGAGRAGARHALAVPVALHPGPQLQLLLLLAPGCPAAAAPALLPLGAAAAAAGRPAGQRRLQRAGCSMEALPDRGDVVAARRYVPARLLRVLQRQRPGRLQARPGAPLVGHAARQHADSLQMVVKQLAKPAGAAGAQGAG